MTLLEYRVAMREIESAQFERDFASTPDDFIDASELLDEISSATLDEIDALIDTRNCWMLPEVN